ncbi:MAG: DUF2520 domain-containing protein [Candidatus Delongbacteria bacterium]|jgi:predicted short-subunit dehydrogenase-like oxidoreductase (DUF2520 family)|nr:DUF2520 domain-containing protein [Candidatus Delongbacteria bacterium]
MSHQISIIGSGNLGTNLAITLFQNKFVINSIISRQIKNAEQLASQCAALAGTKIEHIPDHSDTLFFCVPDDVLTDILANHDFGNTLLIHTAGSMNINVFKKHSNNYAVLYALQTFSKDHIADFKNAPVFIEANNKYSFDRVQQIAGKISLNVQELSSKKRLELHTAAVFACNFTNHMYKIAEDLIQDTDLDFDVFVPLIRETTEKIIDIKDPARCQTGPAVRNDKNTMDKHLAVLKKNKALADLYKIISNRIFEQNRKQDK